jgi:hypothetical protein
MTKVSSHPKEEKNGGNGFNKPKNSLLHSLTPKRVEKYTKAPERAEFESDPPLFLQASTLFIPDIDSALLFLA